MAKADYLRDALNGTKLLSARPENALGMVWAFGSDEAIDRAVLKRKALVDQAGAEIELLQGEFPTQYSPPPRILTYAQYENIIKNRASIAVKLRDAMRPLPHVPPRFDDIPDDVVARLVEKKSGFSPKSAWKEYDLIKGQRARLFAQYTAPELALLQDDNLDHYTPDRRAYLRYIANNDMDFFRLLTAQMPCEPDPVESRRHTYITGGSGSGKTELLKVLIHRTVTSTDGAVVVIDPHGDLVRQVARWDMFKDSDRLLYIDPYLMDGYVPAFNPLITPPGTTMQEKEVIAQQIVNAFEQLLKGSSGDGLTVNMRALLVPCVLILLDRPESTLADLQRFMNDALNDDLVALGRQSQRGAIARFFATDFVKDHTLSKSKSAISRKLQSVFNTYAFDEVVNRQSTIDFAKALNDGKVILFNLAKGKLGDEASEAFGRLVLANIQGIAMRREGIAESERRPIDLFIDECQNYITPATISIMEEARKYGVNLTLAQQVVGRGMSSEMKAVVLNNTNIKFAGRTPEDASMAKMFGKTLEDVQQLATGSFLGKVGNGTPFRIAVRDDLLGDAGSMSAEDWQGTVERLKAVYTPLGAAAVLPSIPAPPPMNAGDRRDLI